MNLSRVYYLERSPLTGELASARDVNEEEDFYRPGELYVLTLPGTALAEQYALRAANGSNDVVDDRLERIARGQYRLRFVASNLSVREPVFEAIRAGHYRGVPAWLLVEHDPVYLDELELEFGYNPIGDTDIGEPLQALSINPADNTPPGQQTSERN